MNAYFVNNLQVHHLDSHYTFLLFVEKRINYISNKIKQYQPPSVVFYGIRYEYSWRKIANVEFSPTSEGFLIAQNSQTVFVIAKHPTAFGVTNEYFHNIGKSIAAKLWG